MLTNLAAAFETGTMPDHFSFSSLQLAITCPEAWRHRYLLRTRGPATSALAVGSGVHAGIADMYTRLRDDKPSKRTLVDSAVETATSLIGGLDVADHADVDEITTQTRELIEVYAAERPLHIKPVETEKRIEIRVADSDTPIIGFVDLEAEQQLVEVKTSSKKVTVPTGSWKVQAWLYQAAIPKPVEWHVLVKSKTPILITSAALAVPYDARVSSKALGLASATLERIQRLYEERGPFEEWPVDGVLHPWACSTCDANRMCSVGYSS